MSTTTQHDVKDLSLAPGGVRRVLWADRQMPVLAAMGIAIDTLTEEQTRYLASWDEGT